MLASGIALAAALLMLCAVPAATSDMLTIDGIAFDTHSAIRIVHLGAGRRMRKHSTEPASFTCVSFRNTDPRAVQSVTFHFVDYDQDGNRVGENDLVRAGRFSTGDTIEGINQKAHEFNQEDCSLNPSLETHLATVIVFVKALTFDDGSLWSTSGPAIPQHLDAQPAPVPSPSAL